MSPLERRYFYDYMLFKAGISSGLEPIRDQSEWIASDQHDTGSKEDCEINAFKRLAEKLKSNFPRLPICILADGLYPSAWFFRICTANNWSFCAVLKDKKLSTLWDQVDKSLISVEGTGNVENAMIVDDSTTIDWVTGLDYRGTIVNWIESLESFCQDSRRFVFVTNVDLNYSSVREIVTPGRSRWRLEDSFNTQKNRG